MDHALNRIVYGPFNFTFNSTNTTTVTTTPTCYTNAICSAWGACSATGIQTRVCNKINISCAFATAPITTQICNYTIQTTEPLLVITMAAAPNNTINNTSGSWFGLGGLSDGLKITIIIVIIILLIGGAVWAFMHFKNPEAAEIVQNPYDQGYDPTNDPKYSKGTSYSDNPDDYLGDNK